MKKNIYRFKGNFKGILFISALLLAVVFLYYTQNLVKELQQQSRNYLSFRIKLFEKNINSEDNQDLSFFFSEVIQTADYPIIYTDASGMPAFWRNISIGQHTSQNIPADTLKMIQSLIRKFDDENTPISISYQGNILGYYHYGDSEIINKLRWLPIVEMILVVLLVIIGYAGFTSIKRSEERFIWVGMAKETAHQLGTPLSSILGWVEYLKTAPEKVQEVTGDIEKDLQRLQKVTNRFSNIGSVPDLKKEPLNEIIGELLAYFDRRLPAKKGKISLNAELDDSIIYLQINHDLFAWVLENLIKNAADAINGKEGKIKITTGHYDKNSVFIDISDTGKGISKRDKKNIFRPGFSTKKRGWGLGLSLARRIINEYHGGKLILKDSVVNQGSTFRIILEKC